MKNKIWIGATVDNGSLDSLVVFTSKTEAHNYFNEWISVHGGADACIEDAYNDGRNYDVFYWWDGQNECWIKPKEFELNLNIRRG